MDIASPETHQALHYLNAVHKHGYAPTEAELDSYAAAPQPKSLSNGGPATAQLMITVAAIARVMQQQYGRTTLEPLSTFFVRVGWAAADDDRRLSITSLGGAVLGAMNDEEALDSGVVVATAIDPGDPFAYAKVIGEIAANPDVLLVDPYLKEGELSHLLRLPGVRRVLTSDELGRNKTGPSVKLAIFEHMVAASVAPGFELRSLPTKDLHDRYVIPASGPVLSLSTSLNSIGRRIGVAVWLTDIPSKAIRTEFEKLWKRAIPVKLPALDETTE